MAYTGSATTATSPSVNAMTADKPPGRYYILDGHEPVPATFEQWAAKNISFPKEWLIARDTVGDYEISTVFLSLDRNLGSGPPILFETMIFGPEGGKLSLRTRRYPTWDAAEKGHATVVDICRAT